MAPSIPFNLLTNSVRLAMMSLQGRCRANDLYAFVCVVQPHPRLSRPALPDVKPGEVMLYWEGQGQRQAFMKIFAYGV
jgi:hypothetical protein